MVPTYQTVTLTMPIWNQNSWIRCVCDWLKRVHSYIGQLPPYNVDLQQLHTIFLQHDLGLSTVVIKDIHN
jgi:hypothetical protein